MSLLDKLAQIQAEVRGLTKDKPAYSYDYVSGDKVLGDIRPRMVELGLLLIPSVTEVESKPVTYHTWDKGAKAMVEKTEVLVTVRMRMTWKDVETGEELVIDWAGTGMNGFDKGFGSALTYGERYFLLKFFHIPTDKDDVDAIAAGRDEALELGYQRQAQEQQPAVEAPAYNPVNAEVYAQFVESAAKGILTPKGRTAKESWRTLTHAPESAVTQFEKDVFTYKVEHNIK